MPEEHPTTLTSKQTPMGRDLARQLLARDIAQIDQPVAVAAAMQHTVSRVSDSLRRAVGDDGFNALLARVLWATEGDHPVLRDIRNATGTSIRLDGIVASVERYGVEVVTTALETVLAALVDVLAGLVGADMVPRLLDDEGSLSHRSNGAHAP